MDTMETKAEVVNGNHAVPAHTSTPPAKPKSKLGILIGCIVVALLVEIGRAHV